MKKWKMLMLLAFVEVRVVLTVCNESNLSESKQISVVSREEGSGTCGAFIDLFGLEEKNGSGDTADLTTADAIVTNSTLITLTTVTGDDLATGYASLGSPNDSVRVLKTDGTKASVETIKDGSYEIPRPFNIVTKEDTSKAAKGFINFIPSSDGQTIAEENGYVPLNNVDTYQASVTSGKVVISGSSSATPVMEKLKKAYTKVNSGATIEIQQSDSSAGITDTIGGTSDTGMAPRELEDSEVAQGVNSMVIAADGIAAIVNKNSTIGNLTSEQVKSTPSGEITTWKELLD